MWARGAIGACWLQGGWRPGLSTETSRSVATPLCPACTSQASGPWGPQGALRGEGSRLPLSPGVRGAWAGTRAMWSSPPPLPLVLMKGRRMEPGVAGRWSQPACFPARPALPSALCVVATTAETERPWEKQSQERPCAGDWQSCQCGGRLGPAWAFGGGTPCPLWGCPRCGHPDDRGSPASFRPTVVCPEPRDDGAQPPRTLQEGLLGPRTAD